MPVTREVIRDLMTVVYAGEASAESRRLVEEHLATDPELAREAEALRAALAMPETMAMSAAPAPSAEKQTLDATRQLLKLRSGLFAVALFFTLLPFTIVVRHSEVTFLLIRDAPVIGFAWWATAAVMWIWYARVRRRMRVTGL